MVVKQEGGVQTLSSPSSALVLQFHSQSLAGYIHRYKNTDIPGFQCENSNMESSTCAFAIGSFGKGTIKIDNFLFLIKVFFVFFFVFFFSWFFFLFFLPLT